MNNMEIKGQDGFCKECLLTLYLDKGFVIFVLVNVVTMIF